MKRQLVETGDGSHSLYVPALDEQYHSRHGALQESRHVFVEMGLRPVAAERELVRVLEIGFGTGLNALVTLEALEGLGCGVHYVGVEAYPLGSDEVELLNYGDLVGGRGPEWMAALHGAAWGEEVELQPGFVLRKVEARIEGFGLSEAVDLVYFDAFAPEKQPELWTEEVFGQVYGMVAPGGRLVTYCAKGVVRRRMQAVGFEVERLPGPPGKREMLAAVKPRGSGPR